MTRVYIHAFLSSIIFPFAPAEPSHSFELPAGSYAVTVTFGSAERASETTVLAESRQLMLERVKTQAGEFAVRRFHVNTRTPALAPPPPFAPGASSVLLNEREIGSNRWDAQLTLDFLGTNAAVKDVRVEPSGDVPVVYLLGDSTVADQPNDDFAGWGQMLPRFFKGSVAVANHAESGETLKSFIFENRLNKVLSTLTSRDIVLIQFGHNDQKEQWPQTYLAARSTWPAYLKTYIAEIRKCGATPVLITSMERRNFDLAGRIQATHGEYPQVVREVAAAENVALIDLQPISVAFYEAMGPKYAPLAFANNGKDGTHHNAYGAYHLALAVAHEIKTLGLPLASHLADNLPRFDPVAHPEDVAPARARSFDPSLMSAFSDRQDSLGHP